MSNSDTTRSVNRTDNASLYRTRGGGLFTAGVTRLGVLPILTLIAIVCFQLGNDRFLSAVNIANIAQQSVYLLLIALAQMLVLIAGGFDLSVGTNVALTSVLSSLVMVSVQAAYPDAIWLPVLAGSGAALLTGITIGVINALGVAILRVNPFVITLATASIFQGITLIVSHGVPVSGLPSAFIYEIGSGRVAGIPMAFVVAVPAFLLVFVLVNRTRFGRYLFAVGSNERAAKVMGISVSGILIGTYVLCAVLTAFAGFLLTARISSGEPQLGAEFPLMSIAAAIIGGCSLRGGKGSVIGALLGGLFVVVLSNGMDLMRLGSNYQMIALGIVLVAAVLLDQRKSPSS